jgi:hypothetical protein
LQQQQRHTKIVNVHFPKKVLDPDLVRAQFGAILQVLGNPAKLYVPAFYHPQYKQPDELFS